MNVQEIPNNIASFKINSGLNRFYSIISPTVDRFILPTEQICNIYGILQLSIMMQP